MRAARLAFLKCRESGMNAISKLKLFANKNRREVAPLIAQLEGLIQFLNELDRKEKSESVRIEIAGALRDIERLTLTAEKRLIELNSQLQKAKKENSLLNPHLLKRGVCRKNLYAILGVSEAATPQAIDIGYQRELSFLLQLTPVQEERRKALQEAWGVLKNPELRAEYDAVRSVGYDSWRARRRSSDALWHCVPGSYGGGKK